VRRGIRLGTFRGVEVVADLSVLLIAGILVWIMYVDISVADPSTDPMIVGIAAALTGVLFVASVLAHEASHAFIARRRGLEVSGIRLLAFGGYTEIEGSEEHPADEFTTAVAGPVVSFVLAGILWLAALVTAGAPSVQTAFQFLAFTNLFIGGFNLLPGFPLDGGRALRAVLWRIKGDRVRATAAAVRVGQILGGVVIMVATVYAVARAEPMALLWALLGWYLMRTAGTAGQRERLLVSVDGLVAADVMHRTPDPVPGDMTVGRVVELFQIGSRLRSLPVEVGGRIVGVLGQDEVDRVPADRRASVTAASAMTGIGPGDVIDSDTPLDATMNRNPGRSGRLVVVDDGRTVGIIEGADLGAVLNDRTR
jgi:Zn-dependent protease/CBS domain-containing protein